MPPNRNSKLLRAAILLVFIALSIFFLWRWYLAPDPNAGLVYGNGRIEATEIDVAAKMAGRIQDILVREGDFVTAGQVVARMDTENLMAQLREAQALFHQAESSVAIANSQ
ncbi:HlyD family secretion protein, partial [Methylophaga sp. UBA1464]